MVLSGKYRLLLKFYLSFWVLIGFLPIKLVDAEPVYGGLMTRCFENKEDGAKCVFAWRTRPVADNAKKRKAAGDNSPDKFILETTAGEPTEFYSKIKISPETNFSYYYIDNMSGKINLGPQWSASEIQEEGGFKKWMLVLPGVKIKNVWCKTTIINPTLTNPVAVNPASINPIATIPTVTDPGSIHPASIISTDPALIHPAFINPGPAAINVAVINPNYLSNIDFKEAANCLFYHYSPEKQTGILYSPYYTETDE
ncbi:MAG: hypothetical protein K0R14_1886 [Burkholderiales bacterium]|nr:hypothetical protein [Burkholderiales bacterium]